jgi:hypothetical protein
MSTGPKRFHDRMDAIRSIHTTERDDIMTSYTARCGFFCITIDYLNHYDDATNLTVFRTGRSTRSLVCQILSCLGELSGKFR